MTERMKMTVADYFDLPETNRIVELIDGEIIMTATPLPDHQLIVVYLADMLLDLKPDGKVYVAPLGIHLDDINVLEPDVFWVSVKNEGVTIDKVVRGAPDLVVEVLSPSTSKRDRKVKFGLYERYGVREYWIIEPEDQLVEVWVSQEYKFIRQGIYGIEESFSSPVLVGKSVEVNKIFTR
jgi:Uma2 family endonuclease